MKIAVYAIAKDEERFVERWYESAREADSLHILDTGSTDGTVALALSLGIDVRVERFDPWRFDVARNRSLSMVPTDVDMCIALDLDEVLQPGWRHHLEHAIRNGVSRPRYEYTWSWASDGSPGLQYGGDKIHSRHGYYWKHPVHEVLVPSGQETQDWYGLQIHHHPDPGKSRAQYLPLLELAVAEDPSDDRNSHYLAREYLFSGLLDRAEAEFRRHLSLPSAVWPPERARSMRYLFQITGQRAWLHAAVHECPDRREGLVECAQHYHDNGNWVLTLHFAERALAIKERPLEYLTEEFAWGPLPYDLAAVAAYRLGHFDKARLYGAEAARLSPTDIRVQRNLQDFYLKAAA